MLPIPKKVADRFSQRLKGFQTIVQTCRDRDINESDTVTLVMDILCDLLGYDKYSEITKEHQIRATYCDLAVTIENKIKNLIECKAIGIILKDNHIQQALNYGANQGCEWIILTNAAHWKIYRVIFGQPINYELIYEFQLLDLHPRAGGDLECLYALSKEGLAKNAMLDFYATQQAKDRYCIAQLVLTDPVIKLIRKQLKLISPNVSVEISEIEAVLRDQVIKREMIEGDRAIEAQKRIRKVQRRLARQEAKTAVRSIPDTPTVPAAEEKPSATIEEIS